MARRISEPFDPARPVVVRKPFTANGRHRQPGEAFDWKREALDRRRVRLLYDAGKLAHRKEAPKVSSPAPFESDELDGIDSMQDLRAIAEAEGAPKKVSKVDQRQAIRDHRNGVDV